MTDPSWLYSTIAQSSAAIVAIMGGFITSRLLPLLAEKRSLKNQLNDKKARLKGLRNYSPPLIYTNRATAEEIQSRKEQMDSIREKISLLKAEIHELETRLETFAYPPHLGWGVLILIYLALSSILFPVGFILTETFSLTSKLFVFVMFALGLVALFGYIALQLREIRRK